MISIKELEETNIKLHDLNRYQKYKIIKMKKQVKKLKQQLLNTFYEKKIVLDKIENELDNNYVSTPIKNKLLNIINPDRNENLKSCSICLSKIEHEVAQCKHCYSNYHHSCLHKWYTIKKQCPVCTEH